MIFQIIRGEAQRTYRVVVTRRRINSPDPSIETPNKISISSFSKVRKPFR